MTASTVTHPEHPLGGMDEGTHVGSPPPRPPGDRLRTLWRGPADQPWWTRPVLLLILAATAGLYLWDLSASKYANSFYAAAAQAGSKSWKALLFGSLDAGNAITVDKPPAAMWIMGLSARIFGFNSWSVLAPQALMGVATVALLYATVRRSAGPVAGLLAAAAMAVTPVAALMFRFNNPDALLTLLMVVGAYCVTRALDKSGLRWLVLAGAALGLAFLTKMLQAFLVLPAFGLVYLVAAGVGWRRRLLHLLAAAGSLLVSAGWFVALVAVWPADSRPYIGGSTNNSLLELALGYNGLSRILGREGGPGGRGGPGGGGPGGGGNIGFGGETGITRMFGDAMGTEISWLLPAALIALVAGFWFTRRAPRTDRTRAALLLWTGWLLVTGLVFSFMSGTFHPYYTVALAPAIAALVGIGGWQLWRDREQVPARLVLAVMVSATGAWDFVLLNRESSWLPALRWVVLVGSGAVAVALLANVSRIRLAASAVAASILAVALAAPCAYAVATASQPHNGSIPSSGPSGAGRGGPGGGRGGMGAMPPGGMPWGQAGGQDGSRATGQGSAEQGQGGTRRQAPDGQAPDGQNGQAGSGGQRSGRFPPEANGDARWPDGGMPEGGMPGGMPEGGMPGGMPGGAGGATNTQLVALLKAAGTKWSAAISGATSAADLELASDTSVIALGGWMGSDPSPTLAQFQKYVAQGKVRYLIAGGMGGRGGPGGGGTTEFSRISTWVQENFQSSTVGGSTVYDLTKKAQQ